MGYLHNHLATAVTGAFAAVLSVLWFVMVPMFPVLEIVFLMAIPITWFLTFMCWISQKSNDYMKQYHGHESSRHIEKKNHDHLAPKQVCTSDGKLVTHNELEEAKSELGDELSKLRHTVKLKDTEIQRLKQEIGNLETRVQIESLKAELANLKSQASKRTRKPKKN